MTSLSYEEPARLSARVLRVTQNNPGRFTGPGTNTFVIGGATGPVFVLDPGEESDVHFAAIVDAVGDRDVAAVLVSHLHRDHWPLAPRVAERFRARVRAHRAEPPFTAGGRLEDGEQLRAGGATLRAIHTPGHASDHLCFLFEEEKALFSADHVMGWSTSIIAPPDGNLNEYMASLEKLVDAVRSGQVKTIHPGHGESIGDPLTRLLEIRDHREERTRQALAAIRAGVETIPAMVERIYADVDESLHAAAAFSLQAHLDSLVADGLVVETRPRHYRATE